MTPYYQDDLCTIYHGDCQEIIPSLDPKCFVVTDPPYGIGWDTDYSRFKPSSKTYAPIVGDDKPFEPGFLTERFQRLVLFGANNYADKLKPSSGWIVWDKTGNGRHVSDLSDAEMAWTTVTGGVRIFSHLWKGSAKASEKKMKRFHPTQKPVSLFAWIIDRFAKPGEVILDPFLGSGSTLRAAKDAGYHAIGIEIDEHYCEIAAQRLAQEVLLL